MSLRILFAVVAVCLVVLGVIFWRLRARTILKSEELDRTQKKSALLEQNFRKLYESMPDAFCVVDLQGRLVEFNGAFLDLLRYTEEEARALTYVQLTPPSWHQFEADMVAQVMTVGFSPVYEKEYIRRDGTVFPVELRAFLIRDGDQKPIGMWAIVRDISVRKQTEQRLHEAKEMAETASRIKSEFLAHMSHEIRTPLNGVIGSQELLACTQLEGSQRSLLQTAMLSAEALMVTLNGILDYAKIEAGKLSTEQIPFSLRLLTKGVCEIFEPRFQAKGLSFELKVEADVPDGLVGDPLRLTQIVSNLLGNALKFTSKGGVVVRVKGEAREACCWQLRFDVEDTGVGIAREVQELLFVPFVQGDSSMSRRYGGTGLGLSICKNLVEQLGGSIWFESEVGKGSIFSFTVVVRSEHA
jgi:PAS domain S-box-containing protein